MAVGEDRREGCDGCGRTVSLENLTTVTMPSGERLACCGNCEPHARNAAEKLSSLEPKRSQCDGCTDEFPVAELEDVVLTDGTVITCCPECRREASGRTDAAGISSSSGDSSSGSSPGRTADGSSETVNSTEIATRRDLCSQCHEWVDEELFRVTTTDGRTEEMCGPCKDRAAEKGIVTEVEMRKSEAREILDVEPGAAHEEIRRAFLQQVKHAHPDRKSGSRHAFKLVTEAYERLR